MLLEDIVPGTKYTARDICRVRSIDGLAVDVGTILCKDGFFQAKYVVEYVVQTGEYLHPKHDGTSYLMRTYTVGIRNLGKFFADHRVEPAKFSKVKEYEFKLAEHDTLRYGIHGYIPVVPMGESLPQKLVVKKAPKVYATKAGTPAASPEAILSSFQV